MRMRSLRLRFALPMVVGALSIPSQSVAQPRSSPVPTTADMSTPIASADYGSIADFVAEASLRFGVPERWIDAVMRVESGGDALATSRLGAMGLMQVMPETYAMMRARLGLGADPYDPHDNIMAGAAYLREMHDRYGSAGFLAAYNAGPGRWQDHLAGVRPLPAETVRYIVKLGRALDANATLPSTARIEEAPLKPEAAPIFVRLSTHGFRDEMPMASSSAEQIAGVDRQPGGRSSADVDAKTMQAEATSSIRWSTNQLIVVGYPSNDPSTARSPSSQTDNPLFVDRSTNKAQR